MVRARSRAIKNLESASEAVRDADDRRFEIFDFEQARAGIRHEKPAAFHKRERNFVHVVIFGDPVFVVFASVDEFRRVEHDNVVKIAVCLHLPRERERIGVNEIDARLV